MTLPAYTAGPDEAHYTALSRAHAKQIPRVLDVAGGFRYYRRMQNRFHHITAATRVSAASPDPPAMTS
jgi:hypothetical protein